MLQSTTDFFIMIYKFIEPGWQEVGKFLGTHLISGMVPAFFIAGAISVFLDKHKVTKLMGANANPFISYPVAAFSGGVLTVCSCGVVPIFTGILQQGAGIGPAFTFLMASPAVNLIALSYTYTLLGTKFMIWRSFLVMASAIGIGLSMKALFKEPEQEELPSVIFMEDDTDRTNLQLIIFFTVLLLITITATGVLNTPIFYCFAKIGITGLILPKLLALALEIILLSILTCKWFEKAEIILWLRKSKSLFIMIFPKVIGGIFLCGLIASYFPLTSFMKFFESNDFSGNFIASILGSLMYFGTIVGVTIVSTLQSYGMHPGAAMTLLLSGPAVSLPSILSLIPIAGKKRSVVFLLLVIIFSAISGYIFGLTAPSK